MDPKVLALFVFLFAALASPAVVMAWVLLARTSKAPVVEGADTRQDARARGHVMRVPFFLLAALFLVFEMGVLILIPWAIGFGWAVEAGLGIAAFAHIVSFLALFAIALAFAIGSGALDWEA